MGKPIEVLRVFLKASQQFVDLNNSCPVYYHYYYPTTNEGISSDVAVGTSQGAARGWK